MKVLIIGGGGREHAMAWKVAQSSRVTEVFVAPGNAGTATEPKTRNIDISATDIDHLIEFSLANQVDLTIVGPEAPLVLGIVDAFSQAGLKCFGPNKDAAQLEGSKVYTKDFLKRHRIPTAAYETFSDIKAAETYIRNHSTPLVIKADGLAAGKGVIIAESREVALDAAREILSGKAFGEAGNTIVIEDFLTGEEASFIVMVDGKHCLPLATSQDHKARNNGDTGPNTGGMGAYSPAPVMTPELEITVMETIITPTIQGLEKDGVTYRGFLYAGLMISSDGSPKVLEYNCRFGDPETQPILMRLDSDLAELCLAGVEGRLNETDIEWNPQAALGVVMAAHGYPGDIRKGDAISGIDDELPPGKKVFHAGTTILDNHTVTNGGRVLCACALGNTVSAAQESAYQITRNIQWEGAFYRTDIGHRATLRENKTHLHGGS